LDSGTSASAVFRHNAIINETQIHAGPLVHLFGELCRHANDKLRQLCQKHKTYGLRDSGKTPELARGKCWENADCCQLS